MPLYRVTVVIDAPDLLAATMRVAYPDGENLEGIVAIEGKEANG